MIESYQNEIGRVMRSKQAAQATYDRISRWYDLLEGRWETRLRVLGLQKLRAQAGERVLEIGVGTGHSIAALARAVGESGRVYGFDLSPRMLGLTRERVERARLTSRVELGNGDAAYLPFEDDTFDAIFMSFVLELFDTPEIPQVLAQCCRVLRGGGRICVVSLSKEGGPSRMRDGYEWGHAHFPNLLDCRPIFVQRALEGINFQTREAIRISLWGLPVEIVLAAKQP